MVGLPYLSVLEVHALSQLHGLVTQLGHLNRHETEQDRYEYMHSSVSSYWFQTNSRSTLTCPSRY